MPSLSDRLFQQTKDAREFYEQLMDTLADVAFCVKNGEGQYVVVNDSFLARVHARSKEEVIGKTAADLFPKALAQRYHSQDLDVLRKGKEIKDAIDMTVYPNGSLGWCLTSKIPIKSVTGGIIGLATVSKDLSMATQYDTVSPKFTETIDYIQTHFNERLDTNALAQMAAMTVSQFQRRMKLIFSMTVGQFIQKTRVGEAARLLKTTDAAMSEVAYRCGYCDQSALTRRFKEATGFTPSEYRTNFKL